MPSVLLSEIGHYFCRMFGCRLEPVYNSTLITSVKAASPTSSLRGLQEAAFTPSSLWLISMHFHVRQQVQWEPLTNSLRPITSLVPHTVLPWPTFSRFCKQPFTILTLGKRRKLPELQSCEQEWIESVLIIHEKLLLLTVPLFTVIFQEHFHA